MAGSSLSAPHPTVASLLPILNDTAANSSLLLLGTITGNPDTTANVYQVGCKLIATDTATEYLNTGTAALPVWSIVGTQSLVSSGYMKDNANGANNAICVSWFSYGTTKVALTTGTRLVVHLGTRTLQKGSNTLNVNGTTKNIVSHFNPTTSLGLTTAYGVYGNLDVMYAPGIGAGLWLDMSQ